RLKAKKNDDKHDDLSLYLEVADSKTLPLGWRRHAKVSITIVNQIVDIFTEMRDYVYWLEKKLQEVGETRMQEIEEELKDLKNTCSDMNALLSS
ncbi:unnamed protein product, partial [Thlaspi arvense]